MYKASDVKNGPIDIGSEYVTGLIACVRIVLKIYIGPI